MKPIRFKLVNCTYAENQKPYLPLPAHKFNDEQGRVTTCWQMSFNERLKVLFTGKIYFQTLTFNKPLQPQKLSVEYPL